MFNVKLELIPENVESGTIGHKRKSCKSHAIVVRPPMSFVEIGSHV